jgi:biopolymer transport protein TolQ
MNSLDLVLLSVLGAWSLCTWYIVLTKYIVLDKEYTKSKVFYKLLQNSQNLSQFSQEQETGSSSPGKSVFFAGFQEFVKTWNLKESLGKQFQSLSNVERALGLEQENCIAILEKGVSFLATTASIAPFVGLLGTVLGIIQAFQKISLSGSANLADVAPGISQALISTASGLVVDIPALIFYNHFQNKITKHEQVLVQIQGTFINLLERNYTNLQ